MLDDMVVCRRFFLKVRVFFKVDRTTLVLNNFLRSAHPSTSLKLEEIYKILQFFGYKYKFGIYFCNEEHTQYKKLILLILLSWYKQFVSVAELSKYNLATSNAPPHTL